MNGSPGDSGRRGRHTGNLRGDRRPREGCSGRRSCPGEGRRDRTQGRRTCRGPRDRRAGAGRPDGRRHRDWKPGRDRDPAAYFPRHPRAARCRQHLPAPERFSETGALSRRYRRPVCRGRQDAVRRDDARRNTPFRRCHELARDDPPHAPGESAGRTFFATRLAADRFRITADSPPRRATRLGWAVFN